MSTIAERNSLLQALALALSDLPKAVRVRTDAAGPNRLTFVTQEVLVEAQVARLYESPEFLAACESIAAHYGCTFEQRSEGSLSFRKG